MMVDLARAREDGNVAEVTRLKAEYETLRSTQPSRTRVDALLGGKASLKLAAPLFPGDVAAISEVDQLIDSLDDRPTRAWELRPNKPGDYKISLVLRILDASTGELLIQNERVEIAVHVEGTFEFWAGRVWTNMLTFLSSLEGLLASVVALGGSIIGIRQLAKRCGKDEQVNTQSTQAKSASDSGAGQEETGS